MELRAIWWLIAIGYLLATLLGAVEFSLWSQVELLWEAGVPLEDLVGHAHSLRYVLVLAVFMLADSLSISADWVFSQVAAVLMLLTAILLEGTIRMMRDGARDWGLLIVVSVFFILLSLFMNGRISMSIFGITLLLHSITAWERRKPHFVAAVVKIFCGILFTSVSSGTLFVSVCIFYGWLSSRWLTRFRFMLTSGKDWWLTAAAAGVFAVATPFLLILVDKNINAFGGGLEGLVGMLNHGIGFLFSKLELSVLLLMIVPLCFVCVLAWLSLSTLQNARIPILFAVAGFGGGLFGYSTLAMAIPPSVVLAMMIVLRMPFRTCEGDGDSMSVLRGPKHAAG